MRVLLIFTTTTALVLLFCTPLWADITIAGSSTIHPIIKKASVVFYQQTKIKVDSLGGGSNSGIEGAMLGKVDIGMVSRALDPSEAKLLTAHTIGTDGIALIVNTANTVTDLSYAQVVGVFSGKTVTWKSLNNRDRPIILIAKKQGRSTKKLFDEFFHLKDKIPSSARLIGSNAEAIMFVASDPYAVGYVSIGTAEIAHSRGIFIKPLALNGIKATINNIANGRYSLSRPLNLVTQGNPGTEVNQFLKFLLSSEGSIPYLSTSLKRERRDCVA
jgi:phosphate transport system substrate-binding protein